MGNRCSRKNVTTQGSLAKGMGALLLDRSEHDTGAGLLPFDKYNTFSALEPSGTKNIVASALASDDFCLIAAVVLLLLLAAAATVAAAGRVLVTDWCVLITCSPRSPFVVVSFSCQCQLVLSIILLL